ncbi:MAG: sulfatase-like hydrolase/transferase, partial [Candidatus Latescibacteria bacterium]|nr:sulfatase-like hydrolase/transferase [Candidatus Latescibacterota bacterium]
TFPQVFSQNDYATANFGKIHVAPEMRPGTNPGNDIFQFHHGTGGAMGFWEHLGEEAVQMIRAPNGGMNGGIYPDDVPYLPDRVVKNALHWMETADTPFFARISILQPHTPVLPPAKYVKLLEDQDPGLPKPLPDTVSAFEKRVAEVYDVASMPPEELRSARLHYYAQVAWIDAQVGRVMDFLKRTNRLERTVVIFGADHGNPLGETGAFEKLTFTPTVHRVPLLISWPGTIPPGQIRDDICDSLDIARTCFSIADIDTPSQFKGRDLFTDPPPDAIYATIGYGQSFSKMAPNGGRGNWYEDRGWPRRSCIRTNRYRLDKNVLINGIKPKSEDQDIFLADVLTDPAEFTNLVQDPKYADVVHKLSAQLDRHAENSVEVDPECLLR